MEAKYASKNEGAEAFMIVIMHVILFLINIVTVVQVVPSTVPTEYKIEALVLLGLSVIPVFFWKCKKMYDYLVSIMS